MRGASDGPPLAEGAPSAALLALARELLEHPATDVMAASWVALAIGGEDDAALGEALLARIASDPIAPGTLGLVARHPAAFEAATRVLADADPTARGVAAFARSLAERLAQGFPPVPGLREALQRVADQAPARDTGELRHWLAQLP